MNCQRCEPHGSYARADEQGAVEAIIQDDNILGGRSDTYRSAGGTARNDKLDTLARIETIDTSFREELRCLLCATQNLE
jgi:hypothetical protein